MSPYDFAVVPVKTFTDARGLIFEPLTEGELRLHKNVHAGTTEPGQIRGNHFHRRCSEIAVVTGPTLVRVKLDGQVRDYHVPEGEVWKFYFPPLVPHASQNTGARAQPFVAFSTELHDPAHPDSVREILIESGPTP